jgi:hypothetical protein
MTRCFLASNSTFEPGGVETPIDLRAYLKSGKDERIIALMKEGLTQQEVCAEIGIGARTIRDWKDKRSPQYEKEFDEAYQEGKIYQQAWWLKTGRANLGCGKDFNTPLFGLYMANLFGWRSGASRDDEALQEIRKLKEQLGIDDS